MSDTRKSYPTDVSDEEWTFVAPYLTLLPLDADTISGRCSTPCVGSCVLGRVSLPLGESMVQTPVGVCFLYNLWSIGWVLAEIATGPPQGRAPDLAGPEPQDLVDMARRTLAARGESVRLVPSWRDGPFGVEMAGEVLLPGLDARLAPTTFDVRLAQ